MIFQRRTPPAALPSTVYAELSTCLPIERLVMDPSELRVYECDGLPLHKEPPGAVALCASREEVIAVIRWCAERGIPFVPRGAGTGLSGGATPVPRGVVIDVNRMRRILHLDVENR